MAPSAQASSPCMKYQPGGNALFTFFNCMGFFSFSLFYVDGQIRAEHLALKTAGAEFRVGDDHRLKPLLGNFRRFFKDLLGTNFQTNITSFAPFLVEVDGDRLFLPVGAFFQGIAPPFYPARPHPLLPSRSRDGVGVDRWKNCLTPL